MNNSKIADYHGELIKLLEKVRGNKNRRRILEKIAIVELILIQRRKQSDRITIK